MADSMIRGNSANEQDNGEPEGGGERKDNAEEAPVDMAEETTDTEDASKD